MRTFHVGGTAQVKEESQIIAHASGEIKIINRNVIEDSEKNKIIMGRNTQVYIEDENERQLAIYKVPYGARIYFENKQKVKYRHPPAPSNLNNNSRDEGSSGKPFVRNKPKIGRNEPCPCGSGKKYKKCHGAGH